MGESPMSDMWKHITHENIQTNNKIKKTNDQRGLPGSLDDFSPD